MLLEKVTSESASDTETDGKLFNLRKLHTKTKVLTDITRDFLFADDCSLNAGSEATQRRQVL